MIVNVVEQFLVGSYDIPCHHCRGGLALGKEGSIRFNRVSYLISADEVEEVAYMVRLRQCRRSNRHMLCNMSLYPVNDLLA